MEKENTNKRMRKLMMLLNEYEKDGDWYITYIMRGEKSERELQSSYMFDEDKNAIQNHIISKSFWFIERLVENDKIDFGGKLNTIRFENLVDQTLDSYLALLMLLSIQDEPVKFLSEILK